jgi:hypothetical protein
MRYSSISFLGKRYMYSPHSRFHRRMLIGPARGCNGYSTVSVLGRQYSPGKMSTYQRQPGYDSARFVVYCNAYIQSTKRITIEPVKGNSDSLHAKKKLNASQGFDVASAFGTDPHLLCALNGDPGEWYLVDVEPLPPPLHPSSAVYITIMVGGSSGLCRQTWTVRLDYLEAL